jgi:hypothetical protein
MGVPGKVKRAVSEQDLSSIGQYAERYAGYKQIYRAEAMERGEKVDWSRKESE